MLKLKRTNLRTLALLSGALLAGCSDSDKNAGAGNPGDPLTPPTVLSVTPLKRGCRRLSQYRFHQRDLQQGHESRHGHYVHIHFGPRQAAEAWLAQSPTLRQLMLLPLLLPALLPSTPLIPPE